MGRLLRRSGLLAVAIVAAVAVFAGHVSSVQRSSGAAADNTTAPSVNNTSNPVSKTPLGVPQSDRARPLTPIQAGTAEVTPPTGESEETDNYGEGSNPTSNKYLTYRGGAVQTAPHIYLVFWGPNWFTNGDPSGVANRLHYLYQGLGGSGWANVLKQYTSNYGSFANPSGQYLAGGPRTPPRCRRTRRTPTSRRRCNGRRPG